MKRSRLGLPSWMVQLRKRSLWFAERLSLTGRGRMKVHSLRVRYQTSGRPGGSTVDIDGKRSVRSTGEAPMLPSLVVKKKEGGSGKEQAAWLAKGSGWPPVGGPVGRRDSR